MLLPENTLPRVSLYGAAEDRSDSIDAKTLVDDEAEEPDSRAKINLRNFTWLMRKLRTDL